MTPLSPREIIFHIFILLIENPVTRIWVCLMPHFSCYNIVYTLFFFTVHKFTECLLFARYYVQSSVAKSILWLIDTIIDHRNEEKYVMWVPTLWHNGYPCFLKIYQNLKFWTPTSISTEMWDRVSLWHWPLPHCIEARLVWEAEAASRAGSPGPTADVEGGHLTPCWLLWSNIQLAARPRLH